MTTANCKQLIKSVSNQYLLGKKDKWKRTRKYKENELVLREFQGTSGDLVVISESSSGVFSLFNIELANTTLSAKALSFLNKETLLKELSNLNKKHLGYEESFSEVQQHISIPNGHELIRKLRCEDSFVEEAFAVDISFDMENRDLIYCKQDNVSYLRLECGGDSELPVIAYAYWSEKNKCIKGFFPCGEGNVYNVETNTAYGSENAQDEDLESRYEEMAENVDYDTANRIGFQQLLNHIGRDYQGI